MKSINHPYRGPSDLEMGSLKFIEVHISATVVVDQLYKIPFG
jgi:hypothetical protein